MTPAHRIVQHQETLYSLAATSSSENAAQLEDLLEASKPAGTLDDWHILLSTPFRYPPAIPADKVARFSPPFSGFRALYCSETVRTTMYEYAYSFLRERINMSAVDEIGSRTLFEVFLDAKKTSDLTRHPRVRALTDRNSYAASHEYIEKHPDVKGVKYPSCRDPKRDPNFAIFDIHLLRKDIGEQRTLGYFYRGAAKSLLWPDFNLEIPWNEVN